MEFAQNLRSAMDNKSMTMYRLAKELGIHQTTIKNWLDGKGEPRISEVHAIADVLGVDFISLATFDQALADIEENGPRPPQPTPKERIDTAFEQLNEAGQYAAAFSIELIAGNPQYQHPAASPSNSTPAPEPPPETPENGE